MIQIHFLEGITLQHLIVGGICAVICFVFAYFIWGKKKIWIVSGYTDVKEKDKFAKYMGMFSIATGIYLFVLFALINSISSNIILSGIFAYALFTIIFRIVAFKKIK